MFFFLGGGRGEDSRNNIYYVFFYKLAQQNLLLRWNHDNLLYTDAIKMNLPITVSMAMSRVAGDLRSVFVRQEGGYVRGGRHVRSSHRYDKEGVPNTNRPQ